MTQSNSFGHGSIALPHKEIETRKTKGVSSSTQEKTQSGSLLDLQKPTESSFFVALFLLAQPSPNQAQVTHTHTQMPFRLKSQDLIWRQFLFFPFFASSSTPASPHQLHFTAITRLFSISTLPPNSYILIHTTRIHTHENHHCSCRTRVLGFGLPG